MMAYLEINHQVRTHARKKKIVIVKTADKIKTVVKN